MKNPQKIALQRIKEAKKSQKIYLDLSIDELYFVPTEILILSDFLQELDIGHSFISNLEVVGKLRNLKILCARYNLISDISPLQNLENLQELDLIDNDISDISPLKNLKNLRKLYLMKNQIVDISPLKELNLEILDVSYNLLK